MFILGFRGLLLAISLALGFVPAYAASINLTVERVASNLPGAAIDPNGPVVRIRWEAVTEAELYEVTWDNLGTHLTVRPTTALRAIDNQPADQGKTYKVTAKKGAETLATGSVKGGAKGQALQTSTGGAAQPESPLGTAAASGTIKYRSPDLSPLFESREYETLGEYLGDLIKVALVLSVVAATLVVVYAGFDYLNSGGSPEATARAKEMIAGALFGLATVFLAGVFLVSLYSTEALAPPTESGGATGQRGVLVNQLSSKLEQLKTLAKTAGVTLTPTQEQKLKSAIEKAASEGKPDAVKQAISEVAAEIAKRKPQLKSGIDQKIGKLIKEVEKTFTESAPAQGTGSEKQDSKQKTRDPTARTPSKRITQVNEQYLDGVTQFLAAAVTKEPCSLTFEHQRFELIKPVYARAHCSPPQPKYRSLLEAAQQLAAHAQKNEKAYEEIQKSITSSGYKACNLFILTATALTVDSGVSGKDLGSLDKCPKANQFDEYLIQRGYQTIPLETYRNNVRGIKPGDILQREVAGTGHVVVVEKVVVEGKQRKIQTIEASLGQLHPRRRIETFEFYLDERKFDNVIRKP